jgi:hypothetical protein
MASVDALACNSTHSFAGIDGVDAANRLGVMLKIQSGAEADLEDFASHSREKLPAQTGQLRISHRPIADSWEDDPGVEAHADLPRFEPRPFEDDPSRTLL